MKTDRITKFLMLLIAAGLWANVMYRPAAIAQSKDKDTAQAEVRAHKFVLVDENDKQRAVISTDKANPLIALYDQNQKIRVGLNAHKDGPGLLMYDAEGKQQMAVFADKNGPGIIITDEKGKIQFNAP